jgi:hypothetical protein
MGYNAVDMMWWRTFEDLRDRISAILPLLDACLDLGLDKSPQLEFYFNHGELEHFGLSKNGGFLQYNLGKGNWVSLGYPEEDKTLDEIMECVADFNTPEEHYPPHRAYYKAFVERYERFEQDFYCMFDGCNLEKHISDIWEKEKKEKQHKSDIDSR